MAEEFSTNVGGQSGPNASQANLPEDVGGQWSDVFDWPIIGIESILTPDGKILTYGTDQLGQQGGALVYDVWDPATNTHYTLPNKTPTDMFCSAAIVVPSTGEILISGGDARPMGHVNMGVARRQHVRLPRHECHGVGRRTDVVSALVSDGCRTRQRKDSDPRGLRHDRQGRRDARALHSRSWLEKSDGRL